MTKESAAKEPFNESADQKLKIYEQNVKLCRAVQAQPCIYDRSHPQHHKDILKAWKTIAAACEDTASSCKVRWQNIRYAFMRSLQATKKRQPNRTRQYYLHDVLEFFIPHMAANTSSGTDDDEMDDIDLDKTENQQKPVSKSPVKQSGALDEERTTSANETVEDEEITSTSDKKKVNTFFIKEQADKIGKFIIRKAEHKENGNDEKNISVGVDDDDVKIVKEPKKVNLDKEAESLNEKPKKTDVKEAAAAENVEVETDGRQFRFRRACKRSMDKSMVQQLRNPSPKRETEPKRTRRSLGARRATLKPKAIEPTEPMQTTPTNVSQVTKVPEEIPETKSAEKPKELLEESCLKSDSNVESMLSNNSFIPSDIVETQMKASPVAEQPVIIEWTSTPTSASFVADSNKTCVPFLLPASLLKFDRAVQCDREIQGSACDDEFLNMLRPQMAAMNARQKLHFKQKIFKSLIEVFDDANNFPNSDEVPSASAFPAPPFTGVSPTTGAEMRLIRELVSLVQAAKLTPELMKSPLQHNKIVASAQATTRAASEVAKVPSEVAKTLTEAAKTKMSMSTTPPPVMELNKKLIYRPYSTDKQHHDEGAQRQQMRKVIKVSGMVNTPEGEKRRIYRILPKSEAPVNTTHTPVSSVGTFIIPRAPGSIASSVNAAAAAAASSSNASGTLVPQDSVSRQIPVSGGTVYVSAAAANSPNTTPGNRRMMTIRSTVRPSGTCVPRQIVRRYSICGSGNMSAMDSIKSTKIITTTVNTPPHEVKLNFTSGTNTTSMRYVRTTATATPPFKQSQFTPTTTVTQALTTRTTPTVKTQLKNNILPEKTAKLPTMPPAIDPLTFSLSSFNSIFSASSSSTSSTLSPPIASTATAKNPAKTTNLPLGTANAKDEKPEGQRTADQGRNKSLFPAHGKHEDTAAVIASDYFGSFNIKNEPLD